MKLTRCAPVVDACAHPIFNLLAVAITRSSLRVKSICIQHPAHRAYIPPGSRSSALPMLGIASPPPDHGYELENPMQARTRNLLAVALAAAVLDRKSVV